tara:strand:- start:12 stop:437 length:426 start_codon:yes stop_codon:yes gene_type:complete
MVLISHRGNIQGKSPGLENMPEYINDTLNKGYHVEIDVWYKNGFYLGHDNPQYNVKPNFLAQDKIWCHAKNIEAIIEMSKYPKIHYFWHQEDDITLTSKGYIWAYPGKQPIKNSIAVLPEIYNDNLDKCIGICSDNIQEYI